jgi:hypothetical protein
MFSKIKIALSAAMVLSAAFPASAASKHHRVTHVLRSFTIRLDPTNIQSWMWRRSVMELQINQIWKQV